MLNGLSDGVIRSGRHHLWRFKARAWLSGSQDKCDRAQKCLEENKRSGAIYAELFYCEGFQLYVCFPFVWAPFLSRRGDTTLCRRSCYVIVLVTLSCLILFLLFLLLPLHIFSAWMKGKKNKPHDIIIKLGRVASEGGYRRVQYDCD